MADYGYLEFIMAIKLGLAVRKSGNTRKEEIHKLILCYTTLSLAQISIEFNAVSSEHYDLAICYN